MTWQPGLPIVTVADHAEWQAWRKTRKLEEHRERRATYARIDYYPSDVALRIIGAQRIRTDQFGAIVGLMGFGTTDRPHFVENDRDAGLGQLPGGFATGQAGTDHVNGFE